MLDLVLNGLPGGLLHEETVAFDGQLGFLVRIELLFVFDQLVLGAHRNHLFRKLIYIFLSLLGCLSLLDHFFNYLFETWLFFELLAVFMNFDAHLRI